MDRLNYFSYFCKPNNGVSSPKTQSHNPIMKKITIAIFLLFAFTAGANPVSPSQAELVAQHFWQTYSLGKWQGMADISTSVGIEQIYLFANPEGGFVIVSADDCARPILGYSATSVFSLPMPENVRNWLEGYAWEIQQLSQHSVDPSPRVADEWKRYRNAAIATPTSLTAVAPLLPTSWSQGTYYNDLCPVDASSGQHTATGCVATAMAQVMKYWNHPAQGMGSQTYNHPTYGIQSVNFGTATYDWPLMPNALNSTSSAQEVQAVATLMYHVGVSIVTNYGLSSSGGSAADIVSRGGISYPCVENALRQYFDYHPQLFGARMNGMGDDRWRAMLRMELDSARPIIYSGFDLSGGHCFVCDGYDSQDYFHFNWGWGGTSNGYFAIGSLNPSVGGIGTNVSSTFNLDNMAVFGIRPAVRGSSLTSVVSVQTDDPAHASVTGGGSYNNFSDLVTLTVAASDGYRFDRWNDGMRKLPREFWANGDVTLTAHILPVVGDTIAYCGNSHEGNLMNRYFAIKVNAADLPAGQSLKSVQLFNPYEGDYSIRIHSGDTYSPGAQVYEETFHLPGSNQWETLRFSQPVPISNSNNLWIVGRCTGNDYPVPVTTYCGNQDGGWTSTNGVVWSQLYDMTVMCRAIFSQPTDVVILASAADTSQGHVRGGGRYALGETCTLIAIPSGDNVFDHWQDGNTDNPRTFSATTTASYTAYFSGCGIASLPVTQDFSNGLDCWTTYSASVSNADALTIISQSSMWGSFDYFQFCSQSYSDNYDQYLISPRLLVPNAIDMTLSYRCQGSTETFNIEYSTTDNSPSSFTHVVRSYSATSSVWDTFHVHIPAEAKYIAIHYTTNHGYYFFVDDIQLVGQPLPNHTINVVSESEVMGTVTGGGTLEEGTPTTIQAFPNNCYQFSHWQDGNTQNPRTVVATGDITYTASFVPLVFFSTENIEACDSLLWHETWYRSSTSSASFSTTTDQGCDSTVTMLLTLHHSVEYDTTIEAQGPYTIDGVTYEESTTIVQHLTTQEGCDSLVTIHLIIQPQPRYFVVTVLPDDESHGFVAGGGSYLEGQEAQLTAIPSEGFLFHRWDNGETQNPYTLLVESDTTVVAEFLPTECIPDILSQIRIHTLGRQLTILNAEGCSLDVVDEIGRRVAHVAKAEALQKLMLPNIGVYFIRIDNQPALKVVAH